MTDTATIEANFWNPFVAAWRDGGKTDPKRRLRRFEAGEAQLWESTTSLMAGLKIMIGRDPREVFDGHSAHVRLDD